jgi:hypothetical protein
MLTRVQDIAELIIAQRRQSNLSRQKLAACGEDDKDEGTDGEDLPTDRAEQDETGIAHGVNRRMPQLELDQQVRGVQGKDA